MVCQCDFRWGLARAFPPSLPTHHLRCSRSLRPRLSEKGRTMSTIAQEREALDAYSSAISSAAERAGPSVVKVETGRGGSRADRGWPRQGIGSGVIFASDGAILTNAHVVAGASRVMVTLPEGRNMPAGVLGAEPARDLAVLRVGAG